MKSKINTVSFIGAGNVATHLAVAFKKKVDINFIFSKSGTSARVLADHLSCKTTFEIEDLIGSDLIIVAVADDQIIEVAEALKPFSEVIKNTIIVHTSGSVSSKVFKGINDNYGVLYPLQTFTKSRKIKIKNVPFLIVGSNKKTENKLFNLADRISRVVKQLGDADRKKLHLSAVIANNFINHLYFLSEEYCKVNNLDPTLLSPLVEETIAKALDKGGFDSQTGPARRNDDETIQRHLEALNSNTILQEIYTLFSISIKESYKRNK